MCLSAGSIHYFRSLLLSCYFWATSALVGGVDSYPGENMHLCAVKSKPYCSAVARSSDKESRMRMDLTVQSEILSLFLCDGPNDCCAGCSRILVLLLSWAECKTRKCSYFLQHWMNAFQWAEVSLVIYCPFLFFYVLYLSFLQ